MKRATRSPLGDAIKEVIETRNVWCAFQPIVDLKTGKIFAYESLARTKGTDFDGPMALFAAAVAEGVTGELGRLLRSISLEGCTTHPLFLNIHPAELNEKWVVQPDDPIFQHHEDVFLEITEAVPLSHFRLGKERLKQLEKLLSVHTATFAK